MWCLKLSNGSEKKKMNVHVERERERKEGCVANVNERIERIGVHCTVPSTLVVWNFSHPPNLQNVGRSAVGAFCSSRRCSSVFPVGRSLSWKEAPRWTSLRGPDGDANRQAASQNSGSCGKGGQESKPETLLALTWVARSCKKRNQHWLSHLPWTGPWLNAFLCVISSQRSLEEKQLSLSLCCNWGHRLEELPWPAQGYRAAKGRALCPQRPAMYRPLSHSWLPALAHGRLCASSWSFPFSTDVACTVAQVFAVSRFRPTVNSWGYSVMALQHL